MEVAGSRALVTGASGGLGQAIAKALRDRGADVVVSARREDVLAELCDRIGARHVVADLADRHDVERLAAEAGDVDILVPNAGLPGAGRLEGFSPEEIDRALDVNLRAPIQLTRALLPAMLERRRGHIVFIGSTNAKIATARTGIYAATKFGLRGFAISLRDDLHGTGVGVGTVHPGFIRDAGMWADTKLDPPPGVGTNTSEEVAAAVVKTVETGRAEINVMPLAVRAAAQVALAAPALVSAVSRVGGSHAIADRVGDAHRSAEKT